MEKRKVIFDCDIGCDDAIALISLLAEENINILGITCVRGNIPLENVVENALKVCDLFKKPIPVYAGCAKALVRTLHKGRDYNTIMERIQMIKDDQEILIHQKDFDLPKSSRYVEDKHACSFIVDTLKHTNEKIDIVAVGPLTNIALALRMEPTIVNNINNIFIMGGGLFIGNRTPVAEANFYDDPEAAEIVMESNANLVVLPLEACDMSVTFTEDDLHNFEKYDNNLTKFVVPMLQGYIDRCNLLFKSDVHSCTIYDYAAALALLKPESIIKIKNEVAHIDISGGLSDGQMVVDRRGMELANANANIVYEMDSKIAHNHLKQILKNFN